MIEWARQDDQDVAPAKLSVCLCTWNGERFLAELLTSLSAQTQAPDELVVCDDGSTDGTIELVEQFASVAPFPVRLHVNAERAGVVGNFEQAFSLAEGEFLLPCDQDDIWHPRKIDVVARRLSAPDHPDAVLHDSSLVDEAGATIPGTLWELVGFGQRARDEFASDQFGFLVRRPVAAGHALAFSAAKLPFLLPFSRSANHDTWVAQLIAAIGRIALVDEPLVAYRLHRTNAVGLRRRQPVRARLGTGAAASNRLERAAEGLTDLEVRLDERAPGLLHAALRADLHRAMRHLEGRAWLGAEQPSVARLAGGYRWIASQLVDGSYGRYSNGARSAAFDLWRYTRRPLPPAVTSPTVAVPLRAGATVAAVVVEYHSGEALPACLDSLRSSGVDEIVVVDNGAAGGESGPPPDLPAGVRWVPSPDNPGFGAGVNRGAATVSADLLLICNPDILLEPGALDVLRSALEHDPAAGAAGPALVDRDGQVTQSARAFPTFRGSWRQAWLGLLRPSGRSAAEYRSRNRRLAEGGIVDWVTGACILARADAFHDIGGFDGRYFLYVEEVDLCWRLRQAGWRVRYEPRARVRHIGAVSTSSRPYRAIVAHHRSLWRFARSTTAGVDRAALPLVGVGLVLRCGVACAISAAGRARQRAPGRHGGVNAPAAPPPTAASDR